MSAQLQDKILRLLSLHKGHNDKDIEAGQKLFDQIEDDLHEHHQEVSGGSDSESIKRQDSESVKVKQDESGSANEQEESEQEMEDKSEDIKGQKSGLLTSRLKSILKGAVEEIKSKRENGKPEAGEKTKRVQFAGERIEKQEGRRWNQKLKNPKKGRFDPQEERALMKSLNQAIAEANISFEAAVQSLSQEEDKIPRNLQLWTKVGSVLPDRPLASSFKFMKRLLCPKNNSGPWTQEETDMLLSLIAKHGRKWALISQKMNRTAQNIRDKYRALGQQNNEAIQSQLWKFEELVKFLKLVQKYSHIQFLEPGLEKQLEKAEKHDEEERSQFGKRKYNSKSFSFHNNEVVNGYIRPTYNSIKIEDINWKKISDKIGTKTIFDCRNKFVQLLQMEIRGSINKQLTEKRIVEFVIGLGVKRQADIEWRKWGTRHEVGEEEAHNRWMILKRHIEGRGKKDFRELLKAMQDRLK